VPNDETTQALHAALERFERTVNSISDNVWSYEVDAEGNLIDGYIAPSIDRMLAFPPGTINHSFETFFSYVLPDDLPSLLDALKAALADADQSANTAEYRVRRSDGSIRWFLSKGRTERRPDGRSTVYGTTTDITQQKELENRLARRTTLREELINMATIYISTPLEDTERAIQESLATLGAFTITDRVYLFDYDLERNICTNTYEWCAPGIDPQIDELQAVPLDLIPGWLPRHQSGRPVIIADLSALPPENPTRSILEPQGIKSLITVPLMDGAQCIGFVGFDAVKSHHIYDEDEHALLTFFAQMMVSVRKRREVGQRLRKTNRQLEEANRQLEEANQQAREMARQAQAANRAKTLFLSTMSHELRTPMSGVIGMAEWLLGCATLSQEQQRGVKAIVANANALLHIINQILDFSKIEAGKFTLEQIDFNLPELIEETTTLLHLSAAEKGLQLLCTTSANLPQRLRGDPLRLRQILTNLLGNAIKFTAKGRVELRISCRAPDTAQSASTHTLHFAVRDTGCGIPPEKLATIFERFSQAEASVARTHGGSGLGLTIAKHLVEAMGGDLHVKSRLNEGTEFSFTIPFTPVQQARDDAPSQPQCAEKTEFCPISARALVVDDDPTLRFITSHQLTELGLDADTAENGAQAISAARQSTYDVILVDLNMPGMDGFQTAQTLRTFTSVPIIALTADITRDTRTRCKDEGMSDYLIKPLTKSALQRTLLRIFKDKPPRPAEDQPERAARKMREVILQHYGNNEQTAELVLTRFLQDIPPFLGKLESALRECRWEDAIASAHRIAGATLSIGFEDIGETARELEKNMRDGHRSQVNTQFKKLARLFAEILPQSKGCPPSKLT
jgi:signal transduction histidine kinase/DNA-binding NarL/FixJ family response regulator